MTLHRALVTCPHTPAAVLSVLDEIGVGAELRPYLTMHPNRWERACTGALGVRELMALSRIRGGDPERLSALIGDGELGARWDLVQTDVEVPGAVLADLARDDVRLHGHLTARAARILVRHPGTPADVHVAAWRQLAASTQLRAGQRPVLVAAALRYPDQLGELAHCCGDRQLAAQLVELARVADPVGEVIARTAHPRDVTLWAAVAQRVGRRERALVAGVCHRRAAATLATTALPLAVKEHILSVCLEVAPAHWGGQLGNAAKRLGPLLSEEVTSLLARTAMYWWELPDLDDLTDLSTGTLDELWRGTQRMTYWPVRQGVYLSQLACYPNASAALQDAAADAVEEVRLLPAGEQVAWFDATAAAQVLGDIRRVGHAQAGLALPVAAVQPVHRRRVGQTTLVPLVQAAIASLAPDLAELATARAFLALAPTFAGTFAELAATARAIAGGLQ